MKNIFKSLAGLFRKPKVIPEAVKMSPVLVNAYSQPHVLQDLMHRNNMTHGETVIADILSVRAEKRIDNTVELYFCPAYDLQIKKRLNEGDGTAIPIRATLHDLKMPDELKTGMYTLKNVMLTSNGTIQVIPTLETTWEQHYMK